MKKMNHQRGAVLIISMIILLLLTILGVTSMRTTQLEERMAGNARDRHVAFEAAESALVAAEQFVQTVITDGPFDNDGSDGLYNDDPIYNNMPSYVDWSGLDATRSFLSATSIGTAQGVTTSPKYVIQRIQPGTQDAGSNNDASVGGGYTNSNSGSSTVSASTLVRITVRGTGGSDNSVVFLQTVFGVNNF